MVERLRSHFRLLALFVGFSDCLKASVGSRRSHVNRLRFIQSLTHPNEFLQVELEGIVACGKTKKTPGIHGAHGKAVRLAPVIELIDRDHPARARLVGYKDSGIPRDMPLHMPRDEPCGYIRPTSRRRPGKESKRLPFEKILAGLGRGGSGEY